MKKFKKLFGLEGSKGATSERATKKPPPLSQPRLPAGFYGDFPPAFALYFTGPSPDDKKSDCFLLATEDSGTITPIYAFYTHKGRTNLQGTLYSGPSSSYAPLALAGSKPFRSSSLLALPAPPACSTEEGNQIIPMKYKGGSRVEVTTFSITVPTPDGQAQHEENFEWRYGWSQSDGKPVELRLLRLGNISSPVEEVIGIWTQDANPEEGRFGSFQFQDHANTGKFGPYWTLAVVISLLRVIFVRWVAVMGAQGVLKATGKIAGFGLGVAV